MSSRINVGWLALAFAWLIGVYQAGMRPDAVMAGFPVTLFLTLSGVTLLFSIAEANGTLEGLAHRVHQAGPRQRASDSGPLLHRRLRALLGGTWRDIDRRASRAARDGGGTARRASRRS